MKRSLSNIIRALVVLLLFVPAPLAVVGTAPAVADGLLLAAEPAVEVADEADDDEEDPWTARFLAPLVVVISAVALIAAGSYYVVRIRGRYRVV